MCGIAGFTGSSQTERLRAMTDSLHHRGPDAEGFFSNNRINFGHRRLSIIDLATGAQPMHTTDRKISVIFNGEIYNFRDLQKTFLRGYSFTTASDTEVLLHLYREKGLSCMQYLNGMFAFALWDDEQQLLLLARDRMGKKPLYYTTVNGELYFASEPKALLAALGKNFSLSKESLHLYLQFQYVPGSQTLYSGIHKLLPGEYLKWQKGTLELRRYWNISFSDDATKGSVDTTLDSLMNDAVQSRLMSDVPLGIFLSGGIDSSTIAYYAAKNSAHRIKTFSIGFEDPSFDESKYARLVSQHLNTEHHEQLFSARTMCDLMPHVFDMQDEPLADASLLPTYLLSRFVRSQVAVALGGDGADELFAGYPTFIAHRLADYYAHSPQWIDAPLIWLVNLLPPSHDNISFDFKIKRFLKGARNKGALRDAAWMGAFSPEEQKDLLVQEMLQPPLEHPWFQRFIENHLTADAESRENQILSFWQRGYLVDDILAKVDRASMYNSLEVRAPFLDYRIVEYVNTLPYKEKMRGVQTKFLLKKLMRGKIPDEIIDRPKKGFGVPMARWLCVELRELMEDALSVKRLSAVGIFNVSHVRSLVQEHCSRKYDHRLKLWTLICFMEWHRRWLSN